MVKFNKKRSSSNSMRAHVIMRLSLPAFLSKQLSHSIHCKSGANVAALANSVKPSTDM